MFLFDTERTGRSPHTLGSRSTPEVIWETQLKQYPLKGPESTAVIDAAGNLYFGCHDDCVYSLDKEGKVRWQFVTEDKVYSSPILLNGRIYICGNKADVFCLSTEGSLLWKFNGFKELAKRSRVDRIAGNVTSYLRYDYEFRKFMKINAWNSPNLSAAGDILVNLYGLGVLSLDAGGKVQWRADLGRPYNHLAGVAVTKTSTGQKIIAVSQSGSVFCFDDKGKQQWRAPLQGGYNSWGNPTIDADEKVTYCSTSKINDAAVIYKFTLDGKLIWKQQINAGIRGSISISRLGYVVVPTMKGELLFLHKGTGKLIHRKEIATRERGLWTSVCIDGANDLLVNTKLGQDTGSIVRLSPEGDVKWELKYGKALAVPIIDSEGCVFTATWEGKYIKLRT